MCGDSPDFTEGKETKTSWGRPSNRQTECSWVRSWSRSRLTQMLPPSRPILRGSSRRRRKTVTADVPVPRSSRVRRAGPVRRPMSPDVGRRRLKVLEAPMAETMIGAR